MLAGDDMVSNFCPDGPDYCPQLDVDILKIPHHGSDHLSEDFMNAVSAEHVLISAGSPNRSP